MDRNNRDARRATTASTTITPPSSNGLPRRRHRTSLRDSPEDDGPLELPDTLRNGLRDRHVGGKKDRGERIDRLDRLDRDKGRDRERMLRNKRRRGDGSNNHRSIHQGGSGNRGDELSLVGDESSEESVNDNEDDDEDEQQQQHVRLLQPSSAVTSSASALLNHSRRSYPPSASATGPMAAAPKVDRPAWKVADEMIGVSVPRKARSASTKRSHDCWVGGSATTNHASGANGDQVRQPSTSPVRPVLAAASPVNNRPESPSSSNASARKKLKPNGPKQRPPKSVPKPVSSSATQDEIEIAEVLYGMMRQPQGPNMKSDVSYGIESVKMEVSRNDSSKLFPVSHSGSLLPPPQNSNSSAPLTTTAVAPKRKKPRQIKYDEDTQAQLMYPVRNSLITAKLEMDAVAMARNDVPPSNDRLRGSSIENGGQYEVGHPQGIPFSSENGGVDALKMEGLLVSNKREGSLVGDVKEESPSPKKESGMQLSSSDVRADGKIESKRNPADYEAKNHREEKFHIDLMAPPQARPSPEKDFVGDFAASLDKNSIPSNEVATEDGDKRTRANKEEGVNGEDEGVKREAAGEGRKSGDNKEKNGVSVDLHLDVERSSDGGGGGSGMIMMMGNPSALANAIADSKGNPPGSKQQQPVADRSAPGAGAGSLTFPTPGAGWPGGLPPLGYMPPLPGVVAMDGSAVAPAALQPPQLILSQPRPKRCATHFYIARNISYHQQMARIPLWPAATAGPVSLYGAKPSNLSVMPFADPIGNVSARSVNSLADKGQNLGLFPGHSGKDKASPAANSLESQRKPILLQQAIPPGAPGNILHGPAFIFPLSQQHAVAAAAAASIHSVPSKSNSGSNAAPASSAAVVSASASGSATTAAASAMSFNYPNMPSGETQYLAILQNNSYPFPVPAHVGAAPLPYRGTHPQAVPLLNGPFYSSQMLHPSQLQQQLLANLPPMQQGQGHPSISNSRGSSTSLKHLQSHQLRSLGGVGNGSSGSMQGFPSGKNQSTVPPQINQQLPHQVRTLESETAGEGSPSTADSRIPRANMPNIYGQNFPMAMHAPNFSLMNQAPAPGANGANSNNTSEKKQQTQSAPQHQGSKQSGGDSLQTPAFAMSFTNMGSSASPHGLDISSFAQSHAVLQSLPEATRQTYQIMAAAAAAAAAQNAQQKKNARVSDDGKAGGNDASNHEDIKPLGGKSSTTAGQSIAFSRPDLMDTSVSSLPGSSVVDSSIRTLNLGSGSAHASASAVPALVSTNFSAQSPQQLQRSQQQMIQLQKQHQFAAAAAAAARSKTQAASNGSVYNEHLAASTSAAAKYPSAPSSFPQKLIQNGNGQAQSPQWRGSTRPATSSVPSSLASTSATSSSLKLLPQQPVRVQHGQTHISFGNSNPKAGNASQGQQQIPASNQQLPSPPVVVGSPTTSSVSKSTGDSPRTMTSSTGNKPVQAASSLQMQHVKNSQSLPAHKSSSVASGNVPSILGNSPLTSSSGARGKHQSPQQQLSKQTLQQAQLFFSHPYVPVQTPHFSNSASAASATSAYYMQRHPTEQQPKLQQHSQGSASSSSSAMLSLCAPVTLSTLGTCDPVKAVAASNMKGGNLQSQGILHATQFSVTKSSVGSHPIVPTGFSYVHTVPSAVQVKPAEQKQPAGE